MTEPFGRRVHSPLLASRVDLAMKLFFFLIIGAKVLGVFFWLAVLFTGSFFGSLADCASAKCVESDAINTAVVIERVFMMWVVKIDKVCYGWSLRTTNHPVECPIGGVLSSRLVEFADNNHPVECIDRG